MNNKRLIKDINEIQQKFNKEYLQYIEEHIDEMFLQYIKENN